MPASLAARRAGHHSDAAASSVVWKDAGLHVVGGPVASGNRLLVFVTGPFKSVWLDGLDPATGRVVWRVPETMSYATAGVFEAPAVAYGVALAMAPTPGFGGGGVRLEGIEVANGRIAWTYPRPVAVSDLPTRCPGGPTAASDLCVTVSVSTTVIAPSLLVLDATSGAVVEEIAHVNRLMGTGLYETQTAPPVVAAVALPLGVRWRATVSSLFGGRIYDPDYGWSFNRVGAVEIGTVGSAPGGYTFSLSSERTVAFAAASGRVLWRDAGGYQCDAMAPVRSSFLCVGTGAITYSPATKSTALSPGASETIEGFAPGSGTITWRFTTGDPHEVIAGVGVPLLDATHVLVHAASGRLVVLDLENGRSSPPSPSAVFWCPRTNPYSANAPLGGSTSRQGTPRYYPCDVRGHRVSATAEPVAGVGVVDAGRFVWPDTSGLVAVSL